MFLGGSQSGVDFCQRKKLKSIHSSKIFQNARDPCKYQCSRLIESRGRVTLLHAPSIERTRHFIEREYGRLDILVNNAGVAHDASLAPSETPLETIRDVFETNFFGVIAVTQALLPLLRLSQSGRIVNMSSSLGSLTRNADPTSPFASMRLLGYNASKTALNAFTVLLASELRATPIKVNSADPDWCKTDMGDHHRIDLAREVTEHGKFVTVEFRACERNHRQLVMRIERCARISWKMFAAREDPFAAQTVVERLRVTNHLGHIVAITAAAQRIIGVVIERNVEHGTKVEVETKNSQQTTCNPPMAGGALTASCADYALATTGIAGPGGGTAEKKVGTVYIALATKTGATKVEHRRFVTDRETFKFLATQAALDLLRQTIG